MDQPLDLSVKQAAEKTNIVSPVKTRGKLKIKIFLECEFCGKTFDRPSLLKRHLRTHTGKYSFRKTFGKFFIIYYR